jgi:hypothetical protein
MNNIGKPALHGLTEPTVGTFFVENHLNCIAMTQFTGFTPENCQKITFHTSITVVVIPDAYGNPLGFGSAFFGNSLILKTLMFARSAR